MKTLGKVLAVLCLLVAIAFLFTLTPVQHVLAQANYSGWKDVGSMVTYEPICMETQGNGPDVCLKRSALGHLNFTTGTGGLNKDVVGTCTAAAATTCVITFTTAFTAAPVCIVTDQTTAANNALKATPTTTTLTITTTSSSDVFSYLCLGS
jgi:hypothetical protein